MSDSVSLTDDELQAAIGKGWLKDPQIVAKLDADTRQRMVQMTPPRDGNIQATTPPPSMLDALKDSQIGPFGFTPNQIEAYVKNGPGAILQGLKDAAQGLYAKGAHEAINGAQVTAIPMAGPAIAGIGVIPALSSALFGAGGKFLADRSASAMGATPDQAALAGDVGGLAAGAVGATAPGMVRGASRVIQAVRSQDPKVLADVVSLVSPRGGAAVRLAQRANSAMEANATPPSPAAAPVAPAPAAAVPPPTPAVAGPAPLATPGAPSAPATVTANAPAATSVEDALTKLNLTPAEIKQGVKWAQQGVDSSKILERILISRQLVQATGSVTPDQAAAKVASAQHTGKF